MYRRKRRDIIERLKIYRRKLKRRRNSIQLLCIECLDLALMPSRSLKPGSLIRVKRCKGCGRFIPIQDNYKKEKI